MSTADNTPTPDQNDQTKSTSPIKPFKPVDDEKINEVPTLQTKEVLPSTGNDAAGNSYCEDSLDGEKTEYGLKSKDGDTSKPVPKDEGETTKSSNVDAKVDTDAETANTKKSLNPTAATFIFQSKDQGKNARGGAGNRPPRGGFQGGQGQGQGHPGGGRGANGRSGSPAATAPAFVPRTASFGRGGPGGPSGGRPAQNRQVSAAGASPAGVPDSDAGVGSTGSGGEVSVGGAAPTEVTSGDVKSKATGGAAVGNREPRGYVPPPPTKRSKLSSAELEEKMARMRLVNAEALARSEAQARDAEAYATQAAQADKAAVEKEQARRKQVKEEKERRFKEQNRVDQERERARKLKLARLGVGKEGENGKKGEEAEEEIERESPARGGSGRGWSAEREEGAGWNGGSGGGFGRRGEERGSWGDRRGRGRGIEGGATGGRGGAGRGGRGGRSDVTPRDQVKKETSGSKSKPEAVAAAPVTTKETSESKPEQANESKETGTSWADSPAGEQ